MGLLPSDLLEKIEQEEGEPLYRLALFNNDFSRYLKASQTGDYRFYLSYSTGSIEERLKFPAIVYGNKSWFDRTEIRELDYFTGDDVPVLTPAAIKGTQRQASFWYDTASQQVKVWSEKSKNWVTPANPIVRCELGVGGKMIESVILDASTYPHYLKRDDKLMNHWRGLFDKSAIAASTTYEDMIQHLERQQLERERKPKRSKL